MSREAEKPRPTRIQEITTSVFPAFALLAGLELDLFTALDGAPKSVAELASARGYDADRLERVLYALVAAGLVTVGEGRFANTEEAACYLVRGRPDDISDVKELYADLWACCLRTADSVRAGAPQAKHDFARMSEDELTAFLRGLAPGARASGRGLAKHVDLTACERIADVAGGSGALGQALIEAYPHLRVTVVELPEVASITRRFIAEGGSDRLEVVAVDVVREPLAGAFDIAVLRNFLQVLSPGDAERALAHTARGIKPGGAVYIIGIGVVDDSRTGPVEALGIDLAFLNVYDEGRTYTESDYRSWVASAGLKDFERIRLEGGYSMIVARKAG
jgi:SAM-dependent methyltransferase